MKKEKRIVKVCEHCDGEGFVSECCHSYIDDNRCTSCGKFCRGDYCCEGYEEFKKGTSVEVFVCCYSPDELQKALYTPKKYGDSKYFRGKIIDILDYGKALVKINYKKEPIEIDVEDMSTY